MKAPSVLVPLAQGCEELEAITVTNLLRRAGIEVVTAGLDDQPVRARRGTVILPDATLAQVLDHPFDMIVLPGGLPGADHLDQDPRIHQMLKKMIGENRFVAAICAAPKVLAHAGLLTDKQATCFPGTLTASEHPEIKLSGEAVVQDGFVITSKGPGTAMDFALKIIEVLIGREKRDEVEVGLQRF